MNPPTSVLLDWLPIFEGMAFALVVSGLTIVILLRARAGLPQDVPNDRSLHAAPLPRGGGIAIWAGWLPVASVGFAGRRQADARSGWSRGCCWRWSLCGTTCARSASACACWSTRSPRCGLPSRSRGPPRRPHRGRRQRWCVRRRAPSSAWSLNLYNFMDGNDGLAAAMAILGFSAYGAWRRHRGRARHRVLRARCGDLPFFAVNFPPSRIIMGDVGAVPLGFLAAAFGCRAGGGRQLARVVSRARVPAVHRGRDDHARAPRVAPREGLGGASQPLLSAAAPAGRRASRDARDLRRAGWRARGVTALACLRWERGLGWPAFGAWCVAGAALFAAIDYHWRIRPDSIR